MAHSWSNFAKRNKRLLAVFHIDDHILKGYFSLFVRLFLFFFSCRASGSHTKHHGVMKTSQCNTTYQNSCRGSGTKVHNQCTPRQTSLITAWCWLFLALKGFVHSELPTNMRKETSRVKFLVILIDIYPTKIPVSDWSKTPAIFWKPATTKQGCQTVCRWAWLGLGVIIETSV